MDINSFFAFFQSGGFASLTWGNILMLIIGAVLIWVGISKDAEPLLLVPIGFGIILGNIPVIATGILNPQVGNQMGGFLWYVNRGMYLGVYPPLIFLGIGALTDFSYLIANPVLMLLGAAAQIGIYVTFMVANAIGFTIKEAASIGIIGGADGPTAIYTASKLAPHLVSIIAVAGYSYIALIPILQPPISRLLTTKEERLIKMKKPRIVSKREKIIFPIFSTILVALIVPQALSLLGPLMLGNLLKENGHTDRLAKVASTAILDTVTILLMISVGSAATAQLFLQVSSLKVIFLGCFAFVTAISSGILFAKLLNVFKKEKLNPLIGAAGVSAVPDSARVAQTVAQKEDPTNFLLMHAMGPNVAGVIGSAVAAGVFLNIIK